MFTAFLLRMGLIIPSSCILRLKENVNDSLLSNVMKVFSCQGLVEEMERVSLFPGSPHTSVAEHTVPVVFTRVKHVA